MKVVLDSGAVTALAGSRERLREMRDRDLWPPLVPTPVLVESLTGDHRADFETNRLLRLCTIVALDEPTARTSAFFRASAARPRASAVDAAVVAVADDDSSSGEVVVLTADTADLGALAAFARGVSVRQV